jgi:hypothetical protein
MCIVSVLCTVVSSICVVSFVLLYCAKHFAVCCVPSRDGRDSLCHVLRCLGTWQSCLDMTAMNYPVVNDVPMPRSIET